MKTSLFAALVALGILFRATVAQADLVPPGGEGVHACQNKKAGDTCTNYVIRETEQVLETGTCVEEKLDHLRFKFKAHLRCVSASVPKASASAAVPPPSVAPAPSAAPSVVPAASALAAPSAMASIPSASPAADAPKSSGCSLAVGALPEEAWCFALSGMGLFVLRRRRR